MHSPAILNKILASLSLIGDVTMLRVRIRRARYQAPGRLQESQSPCRSLVQCNYD